MLAIVKDLRKEKTLHYVQGFGGSGGIRIVASQVKFLTKGERQPREGVRGANAPSTIIIVQRPR